MSNGRPRPYPYFTLTHALVRGLRGRNRRAWTYSAQTGIRLVTGSGASQTRSSLLPMRLDTAAFMSLVPEEWVRSQGKYLSLPLSSWSLPFATVAGTGEARVLEGNVQTVFETDPRKEGYRIELAVTEALNQWGYGLLSLRDVTHHFVLRSEGRYEFGPAQEPIELPDLELVPRQVWDRVRYRCPICAVVAWGRSGLHLVCGDHNVKLVVG